MKQKILLQGGYAVTVKRVLFLRFSSLGDIINSNYYAKKIKETHPDWQLSWFCERVYEKLIKEQPWVDEVIAWDRKNGGQKEYFRLLKEVRHSRYDILIDMHSTDRSSLFSLLSGIPVRFGCERHYPLVHTTYDFKPFGGIAITEHTKPPYLAVPSVLKPAAAKAFAGGKTLALSIGASYEIKQWGTNRWIEFCQLALEKGFHIALLGSGSQETEKALSICSALNSSHIFNLTDGLTMLEFASAISLSAASVSGDTGASHIAAALGVPSAVLFGSTWNEENISRLGNAVILKAHCPEAGCFRSECEKPCLDSIEASEVFEQVIRITGGKDR